MVLIFDSHPVQYKAPVYQELEKLRPGQFKVVYATDCSVRGHRDRDFGHTVAWDTPLLQGYNHIILNNERGTPLRSFRSLTGRGIFRLFQREKPTAVLISQFLYESDLVAYLSCVLLGIPIWIRHETQDEAFVRPVWKNTLRQIYYRTIYRKVSHAFYIGQLNREHLLRHGISPNQMSFAPYCVPAPVDSLDKQQAREALRALLSVQAGETLLLFSGKLIEKKNPRLILQAMHLLDASELKHFKLVFVGSGALEEQLREMSKGFFDRVIFAGFINQSEMPCYYLASDILILPSRHAGETWGLVVNEALQMGCGVVMTDAVGCHREFGGLERARVIREGDAGECANAIHELSMFKRSFDWCADYMTRYSVESTAEAIASAANKMSSKTQER